MKGEGFVRPPDVADPMKQHTSEEEDTSDKEDTAADEDTSNEQGTTADEDTSDKQDTTKG